MNKPQAEGSASAFTTDFTQHGTGERAVSMGKHNNMHYVLKKKSNLDT